jgi:hypothetical protein
MRNRVKAGTVRKLCLGDEKERFCNDRRQGNPDGGKMLFVEMSEAIKGD